MRSTAEPISFIHSCYALRNFTLLLFHNPIWQKGRLRKDHCGRDVRSVASRCAERSGAEPGIGSRGHSLWKSVLALLEPASRAAAASHIIGEFIARDRATIVPIRVRNGCSLSPLTSFYRPRCYRLEKRRKMLRNIRRYAKLPFLASLARWRASSFRFATLGQNVCRLPISPYFSNLAWRRSAATAGKYTKEDNSSVGQRET